MIRTGGEAFDPLSPFVYFIASNVERMKYGQLAHKNLLIAVNEINTTEDMNHVKKWVEDKRNVFVDSGVYNLAMEHASRNSVSHDVALQLAPDDIDGFKALFDKYVDIVKQLASGAWGYIEIDQGGRENKIKTRARLESIGLRPIPVYHPFSDGWDYFDYLAQNYDRICFGNVVQADRKTRVRLVATAWDRMRKYPNLWIHLLGLTPNEWLNAFPVSSGDSSSWLSAVRWSGYKERSDGRSFGDLPRNFQYFLGSDPASHVGNQRATQMSAYGAYMAQCNWRRHLSDLQEIGCNIYPLEGL